MRFRLLVLTVTLTALAAADAQALYRRKNDDAPEPTRFLWPQNQGIPVCWAAGLNPADSLNKRIRATIEDGWGRFASIWFEGWGSCAGMSGNFIMIRSISGRADSSIGRQFDSIGDPMPTVVNIDFSDPIATGCDIGPFGNSREDCVT